MQQFLHTIFQDNTSRSFRLTNDFFAILTIISITGIVLETVIALTPYRGVFLWIEWVTVLFFTLEYIGRLVAAKRKLTYIFSFFGLVDLIAIAPTFFGLTNLTFLKSVRILRIMRFLRMLRLAKIVRGTTSHDVEHTAHTQHKMSVQIYFVALFASVLLSATALWFVEGGRVVAANIPVTMLWSTKVLLGGASQAQPVTIAGEVIVIVTRFVGLALFGLLINVVGISLKKVLFGTK